MKQLKSSLSDLRRIFARAITVKDIAEPLVSFDREQSAKFVYGLMSRRDFDVIGIREHGVVVSYVIASELRNCEGTVGSCQHAFAPNEIVSDNEPLLMAFSALRERRYVFVNILGHIGGIITRGDLQKSPVRLWLFGLVSLMEMQMLRLVRERHPSDSWKTLLTEQRIAAARRIFDKRCERNEQNDLSDCLQIVDKAKILMQDDELYKLSGFTSKRSSETFFNRIGVLRDSLAHSNVVSYGEWPEVVDLVTDLELKLEHFEKVAIPFANTRSEKMDSK